MLGSLTEPLDAGHVPTSWLVVAPPGAGKSRLVDELAARARQAGHAVWRATVSGHGDPYDVARALLQDAVDPAAEPSIQRAELVAGLTTRGWSGTRGELAADHSLALLQGEPLTAEPGDLFASWAAVLEHRLGDVRTLWIIEDLHLLPPDATAFIETLLRSSSRARSIVLTSRPSAVASVLRDGGTTSPLSACRLLDLRPLERGVLRELVDALVGPGVVPPDAAEGIADASGGNPLFVEELLRTWVQAEVLRREGGAWRFTSSEGPLELPSTVHAIYQSQLDELHAPTRQVATSGSVPGQSFPPGALAAFGVDHAEAGLDELRSLGLLVGPHLGRLAPEVYTYRHALLRDVAYASLPRAERARLHVRFATWMDDRADRASRTSWWARTWPPRTRACRNSPAPSRSTASAGTASASASTRPTGSSARPNVSSATNRNGPPPCWSSRWCSTPTQAPRSPPGGRCSSVRRCAEPARSTRPCGRSRGRRTTATSCPARCW